MILFALPALALDATGEPVRASARRELLVVAPLMGEAGDWAVATHASWVGTGAEFRVEGGEARPLLSGVARLDLNTSARPWRWVRVEAGLPLVLHAEHAEASGGFAGDGWCAATGTLTRGEVGALGVRGEVSAPVSPYGPLLTAGGPAGNVQAVADLRRDDWRLGARAGLALAPTAAITGGGPVASFEAGGPELPMAIGLGWEPRAWFSAQLGLTAAVPLAAPSEVPQGSVEAHGAAGFTFGPIELLLGGSVGLIDAIGVPDARAHLALRGVGSRPAAPQAVVAADADPDDDGVLAADDRCADDAEDRDGVFDGDGCPEPDNDGDGIADVIDHCPGLAGGAGTYGCPDSDPAAAPGLAQVELDERVFFGPGGKTLSEEAKLILLAVAASINADPGIRLVQVAGHATEPGEATANLHLSQERAEAARDFLVEQGGVDPARVQAVGFGDDLLATEADDDAAATHQRVDIVVAMRH